MKNGITRAQRFVGLDVHAETIAVAVAEGEAKTPEVDHAIPFHAGAIRGPSKR